MRVIKQGRPQKGWSMNRRCTGDGNGGGGCGAELLVEEADVFRTFSDHRDYYATFMCCECLVLTDIEDYPHPLHELPSQLGSERKKRQRRAALGRPKEKENMGHRRAASLGYAVLTEPSEHPGGARIAYRADTREACLAHVTALGRSLNSPEYQVVELLAQT